MPNALVWLSFDLGIRGDYDALYRFLDAHEARECGDSLATFKYQYKRDIADEIRKELKSLVELDGRSRVYLVFPGEKEGQYKGRYIVGRRKRAPWVGYAEFGEQQEDVSEQ